MIAWAERPMCICMEKYDMSLMDLLFGSKTIKVGRNQFSVTLENAFQMMRELCDALSACESLNIVHNDLKPGNEILDNI